MDLLADASRDEILSAVAALLQHDIVNRQRLLERAMAMPSAPAIKIRHGGKPGTIEVWQDGRWQAEQSRWRKDSAR